MVFSMLRRKFCACTSCRVGNASIVLRSAWRFAGDAISFSSRQPRHQSRHAAPALHWCDCLVVGLVPARDGLPSVLSRYGNKNLLSTMIVINVVRKPPTVLTRACSNCRTGIISMTASPKITSEGSELDEHTNLNEQPKRIPTINTTPNAPKTPKSTYSSAR
jgi:hypothetical protein